MPTANTISTTRTKARAKRRKPARRKPAAARTPSSTRTLNGAAPAGTRWSVSDRPVSGIGDYAERALLIPVGATLKAQAQLRRFERRGATARKRLEREVRKTRTRFERELRQRRRRVERTVSSLEHRREKIAKDGSDLANRVQERVLNLV